MIGKTIKTARSLGHNARVLIGLVDAPGHCSKFERVTKPVTLLGSVTLSRLWRYIRGLLPLSVPARRFERVTEVTLGVGKPVRKSAGVSSCRVSLFKIVTAKKLFGVWGRFAVTTFFMHIK